MTEKQQSSGPVRIESVEPTLFFVHSAEGLRQGVDVTVVNGGKAVAAKLNAKIGPYTTEFELGKVAKGSHKLRVYVPDVRETVSAEFVLTVAEGAQSSTTLTWEPQRHWEVHLVHSSHHDLGYTDLPSNLLREHDTFIDDVVRFCEETKDYPEESQFRYSVEQGWSILHYFENRPPEAIARVVELMRAGRIEITALFGNETSELCGPEEQIRLLYPSFRLKRRYGIPITSAELNDVPGLSWGLVKVLAGAGIRYFAPGIPDYFNWGGKVHTFWDEEAVLPRDGTGAFWWEGPDQSKVLFWYGHGAGLWTYEQTAEDLPANLARIAAKGYPFDLVRLKFGAGHRDNSPVDVRLSHIVREWNDQWAYPRLIVSTNNIFFKHFENVAGESLRTLRGDLPNTDYTVGATSTAKETAVNRLAHETLLSAEKLASVAALVSDYDYPADTLAEAYDHAMLYDEHTWGMEQPSGPAEDGCWSQKGQFAYRAAALAQDVLSKSTNRIADQVRLDEEGYHVVVFNPLAHERTDVARVPARHPSPCGHPMHWEYPEPGSTRTAVWVSGRAIGRGLIDIPVELLDEPFELIDVATGKSVPYQVVTITDPLAPAENAAYRYALSGPKQIGIAQLPLDPQQAKELVFVAEDLSALGYKTYRLVKCAAKPVFESRVSVGKNTLENASYRLALDPASGVIKSLYDKELQREWVDGEAAYGFNQLVVRAVREQCTCLPEKSTITIGERGPVYASLLVRGDGRGCPQRSQEIILYSGLKRVDFNNRLLRDATPNLEVYFAFPFAANKPQFRYEAANAAIEPITDQLPGSNTDSYAAHHWVAMWDRKGGVTFTAREAPVVALGDLWPGYVSQAHHGITPPGYGHEFLRHASDLKQGHIYSYAMISNFRTNFQPVQVADILFRYSITTHKGDWLQGNTPATGWEQATPPISATIMGKQPGKLDPSASFAQVDQPNVHLLTIKAAEDGDGLIVRVCETAGSATQATVTLPYYDIAQAVRTNLAEENEGSVRYDRHSFTVTVGAQGVATVRLRGRRWSKPTKMAYYMG